MGRPKKCRWVETEPGVTFGNPGVFPLRALQQIVITGGRAGGHAPGLTCREMTQEEGAQQMKAGLP